ncbi:tRNA (guanine(46)-N(7))-methyltransferase TrmB [Methylocapsa palsarum]|uniref:tRNA (guanine-N(7)-)-methyltransferase n=1 Tax=Methylocapsa palsarum TaxID=1612308 RepID=A0A1I3Z742_9HYPH|nr:tRNA (guanine(46)-N(7))-methyltransferase TrmB [Methylocapsa palsarum]SFK39853.1 tRNA (guanine-N7-)-methyltransferase [Methylocapsa palsarum]
MDPKGLIPEDRRSGENEPSAGGRSPDPTDGEGSGAPAQRRLYGRRRGKKLRMRGSALIGAHLPGLSLDVSQPILDPASLFAEPYSALWLEIGFGGGEHLAAEAARHCERAYIGCEPFLNGVAKALGLIEDMALTNVRLYEGDAGDVIGALPAGSLGGVYLLFPDPWPKRRHRKRRFLSDEALQRLARAMRPGAELRFATDIDDNAGWTLARVLRSGAFAWPAESAADWRSPWPDWKGTRYEAKALAEGRTPAFFTFRRT